MALDYSQQVSTGMLVIILVVTTFLTTLKLYSRFKSSTCSSGCCNCALATNDEQPTTGDLVNVIAPV